MHWDDDEPNFTNFLLNWDSGSQHVYKADPDTLYYGPTATGAATVRINAYDPAPQAGMRHVTFPGFFGASAHHVTGTGSLYSRRYPVNPNPTSSGTFTLVGYDNPSTGSGQASAISKIGALRFSKTTFPPSSPVSLCQLPRPPTLSPSPGVAMIRVALA